MSGTQDRLHVLCAEEVVLIKHAGHNKEGGCQFTTSKLTHSNLHVRLVPVIERDADIVASARFVQHLLEFWDR